MEKAQYNLSSLLVPSVQELAKENIDSIPTRYIRPHQEDLIISDADGLSEIPVIDMQNLFSAKTGEFELDKLHLACKEWGFFQITNHGVGSTLLEKVKLGIQDFFKLPMSEKKRFWQIPGDMEGFGQQFIVSEDQKLDWGDCFSIITLPTRVRKPHLFPNLPLPFRDTLELYSQELNRLAITILEQIGKSLKIEAREIAEEFEDGSQSMRMNYYPPCPQPEKVIGLTPHSDGSGITILLQVSEVEGLQIRKDGIWVPVKPLPDAFVVNVGDVLEIMSNGIYRSIEHRATVNSEKERISIATFVNPKGNGKIGPAPSLVSKQTPALFKTIGMEEYVKGLFARGLSGKSYLDEMRIEHGN